MVGACAAKIPHRGAARDLDEIRLQLEEQVENPTFWTSQIDSAYRVFVQP